MKPKNSRILKGRVPNRGDILEITIDSLSYNGGRGVGRTDGIVVFVARTAPGDRVRARVSVVKPRFLEAELVEVLMPGPGRRAPPCPVAERCGGCSWQQVEYMVQVEQKKKILTDALRPLAKMATWETLPFVPAASEFHYRNRIQIQVRGGDVGFFARRSNALVPARECWIAEAPLNAALKEFKAATTDQRVELAIDLNGSVVVRPDHGDPETALFSQVNRAQNERLRQALLAAVERAPEWIMDLYSGAGNFAFRLADKFPQVPVLAVDLSQASVERGRRGSPTQITWKAGDVGQVLATEAKRSGAGLIVLDPPRAGCAPQVLEQILRHAAKQIVYVSCNPTTFARDAVKLVESGRYLVSSLQGVDMFPQTEHVELVAALRVC